VARRFHHISTDEVYGELGADDPPSREDSAYAPSSPYAASKASADHLVRAYGRTYGLPVSLSNCANNYGPFIGREFVDDSPVSLILGDNVLYGDGLGGLLRQASTLEKGALIYGYRVRDPQRYGVIELDPAGRPLGLEEKPLQPKSLYAAPGLYFYEAGVVDIAARLQPSARGELEITDVNREYLKRGPLAVQLLGRGYAWLDAGTPEALLQAANFVQALEERQGVRIACVEEIAYCMGYIDAAQLERLSHEGISSGYAAYLRSVLEDEGHGSPRG